MRMFSPLTTRIQKFAKERNWEKYHHPKNLIINTFIEFSEMAEHLISSTPLSFKDLGGPILDELGDLIINLCHFAGATKIPINDISPADLPSTLSPEQVAIRLLVTLGHLAEPLTWASEEESRNFLITEEMPQILRSALSITLFFAKQLGVCPLETALTKMEKIEKKYPVGQFEIDVHQFSRKKAKYRTFYDKLC